MQFKKLTIFSKKDSLSDAELDTAVQLLKKLERDKCVDYTGKKNGADYVIDGRTSLFGKICLKKNSHKAVEEYIKYMQRQHGSAEEQLSISFEKIFIERPEDVLSETGNNKYLLDMLVWGFVNNHYKLSINQKNYKKIFFDVNPKVAALYPGYKKEVDYLLHSIYLELKG